MNSRIIQETERFVKEYLSDAESGHNWWHISRVRNMAMHIHSIEKKGDSFIIEMASLLHDINDYKVNTGRESYDAKDFLDCLSLDSSQRDRITYIIEHISFRTSFASTYDRFDELDIVQDADRLDAIGAIGIARAFNYGGSMGFEIFNPSKGPRTYSNSEEYTASDSSTINHFYEKLLKLKGMMNTETGKNIAEERHKYMEGFLDQFMKEWNT